MAKKVKIRVISGGQIGADKIGLEEAKKLGFQTGGTAPKKYQTSRGSDLSLKDYGVSEISDADTTSYQGRERTYGPRTEQNVLKSDVTLIYTVEGKEDSPGSRLTRNLAKKHNKPFLQNPTPSQVSNLVSGLGKEDVTINVAGNREFTNRKAISQGLQAASNPTRNMPKNLSKAIQSRVSNQSSSSSPPSNAKTIYFQGPSSGISDPKAFKRALTKRYSQARKRHGDVQVQFRGSRTSQADQLISEWASEGFTKYLPPSRDPKKLQTVSRGHLFRTNKKGLPIRKKEPINISKINAPGESVEKISFSSKGKIVYPGKATKQHHERFLELTGSPKQGGLGLKKGFEAFLDELEDIGRGSTKQAPDTIRTIQLKGKKVTRLPIIGEGQGQVTKVKADIKSMLAGLQVAEDKAKYYSLDQPTLDRISNLKKDVPYPVKSGEYLNISEADSPDLQFIETEDDPNFGPENLNKQYKGKGPFHFGKFGLKAVLSKSDELKPELKDYTDDDKKIRHLSKVDEESMSQEDKAIKKENKQLGKLTKIVKGSRQWKKWTKAPASRRILLNIIGDVFKNKTDTVLPSEKVIRGPHLKGKLISADKVHWTEKQYIGRDRNPELKIRKEMSDEKKLAKQKRIGKKVSMLRTSGDRSLAGIKSYIAQNIAPDKTLSTSGGVVGTRWYPGKGIKLPEKTFPKKPHTPGLKVDAPIDARPKIKIRKVTTAMQKYHKPVSKEAGIKAIEDKLKVKAKKKALPVNKELTSNVTKELQKQFHGKDKPRYKTTVGKGLKFTRGIGAFSLFSSIFGVARARKEAKQEFGKIGIKRDPTALETLSFTLPKFARPKLYRKIPDA